MTPKLAIPDTPVLPRPSKGSAYGMVVLHDQTLVDHQRQEASAGVLRINWERRLPR